MRKIILIFILGCFWMMIGNDVYAQSEVPFKEEFQSIDWDRKKIFGREDIPLPESAPNAQIHGVYSPGVVKFKGKYLMFMGVSVYCGGIYRDSIGMAESDEGLNWKWKGYIIEPDSRTCQQAWGEWPIGMQYQVNSPNAQVIIDNGEERLFLFFDSVLWRWPWSEGGMTSPIECNNLGVAIFDDEMKLLFRNNSYLKSDIDSKIHCQKTMEGFKEPSWQWTSESSGKLWFDKLGMIGNVYVNNLSQLSDPEVKYEGINGGSPDLPRLSFQEELLVYGWGDQSGDILARSRKFGEVNWSSAWTILKKGEEDWQGVRIGSPNIFFDEDNCRLKFYYSGSGAYDPETVDHQSLSIGMAWPKDDRRFAFGVCKTNPSPTITKLLGDANGDGIINLVDFGIWKTEYLSGIKNKADFNKDGSVNLVDFGIWKGEYIK